MTTEQINTLLKDGFMIKKIVSTEKTSFEELLLKPKGYYGITYSNSEITVSYDDEHNNHHNRKAVAFWIMLEPPHWVNREFKIYFIENGEAVSTFTFAKSIKELKWLMDIAVSTKGIYLVEEAPNDPDGKIVHIMKLIEGCFVARRISKQEWLPIKV